MQSYKDKNFSILGDSISTFYLYSPRSYYGIGNYSERGSGVNTVNDTWWMQVINGLCGKLLVNNSYSGSLVAAHPQCRDESYACSDMRTSQLGSTSTNPDVIMIYMGTNDCGENIKLRGEDGDISRFENAYRAMLEKVKRNYPLSEIWCFTLGKAENRDCTYMGDYCKIIRDCAQSEGCKLIELYDQPKCYATIDGVHPDADGMKTIAELVLGQL